jgi:hypothetical protein
MPNLKVFLNDFICIYNSESLKIKFDKYDAKFESFLNDFICIYNSEFS